MGDGRIPDFSLGTLTFSLLLVLLIVLVLEIITSKRAGARLRAGAGVFA
jgi:hypothetical protein